MKRKRSKVQHETEEKLSGLLFHKSKKLTEKLKPEETNLEVELKPAWIDEDDRNTKAPTTSDSKAAILYTDKLKQKHAMMMGVPSWAKVNLIKTEDETEEDKVLRTVGHLKRKETAMGLKPKVLQIKTLPKINTQTWNEGKVISCVEFHPKLSVALVAGDSGVVSLLSVGGETNNKLHSFKLKGWKISTACFTPEGTHAVISSQSIREQYCVYDLVKSQLEMVDLPTVVKKPIIFVASSDGRYIATSDGFDEIFILSAKSKELLRRVKHNSNVVSVCFSHDCEQLYCYSIGGEVTIWDLSMFRSVRKFNDQGCVNASTITTSPCGRLLATGSNEGIVNIYETSSLKGTSTYNPEPFKTINNLTTKITALKFNATTEIMAASSNILPNAVKLVHIPSYNVFGNFPTQGKFLGNLGAVGFSPNSGYMALGNDRTCAYLYRLKHYKNY